MNEYYIITSQIKFKFLFVKKVNWVLNYNIKNKKQYLLEKIIHSAAAIGMRRPFHDARLNGNPYIYEIGEK